MRAYAEDQKPPEPTTTQLCHVEIGGEQMSVVTRTWDEPVPSGCKRCLRCTATNGACTVVVPGKIDADEAPGVQALNLLWVIPVSSFPSAAALAVCPAQARAR